MSLIKKADEIQRMREGGRILAQALKRVEVAVELGVTTEELDNIFMKYIKKEGAEPSFLGYRGYPKALCTSVNDEVVHGIPGDRTLQTGDIIGIDGGVKYNGMYTDMARTIPVDAISSDAQQLIAVTKKAYERAVEVMLVGNTIGDIGATVQEVAEAAGYQVVRALVGHGVGHAVHEEPSIPNFGKRGTGLQLEAGMTLAIEPMVNIGTFNVVVDNDGWTVRVSDGTLSAHFEDTILVTEQGPEILTKVV